PAELSDKFQQWKDEGHKMFKMKIGRSKKEDVDRLEAARKTIGEGELFVDANGAYFPKEAIEMAGILNHFEVKWFEEPVTSDNLRGMRFVKESIPAPIRVASGEYGFTPGYFKSMLDKTAVDVLQADATRCGGITGLLKAGELCEAFHLPISAHCAPSLHLHPSLSIQPMQHVEYFRDHVRIEKMFFDGYAEAREGKLKPDLSRNGLGLDFKFKDAQKYKIT
uniref:enolase C-terminal domain-like protein n=1 Tax=Zunongwangia sp. H14 TaxID=3240792 RepID=UPI003563BD86